MTTEILFDNEILSSFSNQKPSDDTMRTLASKFEISRFTLQDNLNISDNDGTTTITTSLFPSKPHQKSGDPTTYQLQNGKEISFRSGITIRQIGKLK